jgi:phosphopantothenoylcysteine decarboxylase/phosphopantothenate--cysteine ligase
LLSGKRILLIIGGGIAAYKSLELIRLIRQRGGKVRCIVTASGRQFVTPLSVASLSGERVYEDLFSLTDEAEMGHIQLSRDADLLVVAPATADLIAKIAQGRADDLASTALLATDKPVLIAPAMNVRMWEHAATQRNVAQAMQDGVTCIGPNEGDMACGEYGPGRMAEPVQIITAIERHFAANAPLQGYAIAEALAGAGARTTLVSGPTALPTPAGVEIIRVESAAEMLAACERALPADIAVFTAAVADWRVNGQAGQKIKKTAGNQPPSLNLVENPDILKTVSALKKDRPALVIGFAAETENVIAHAKAKRERKGCDWIIANDVSPEQGVMGGDSNTVHVITADGTEAWPQMSKQDVALKLARRIAEHIGKARA